MFRFLVCLFVATFGLCSVGAFAGETELDKETIRKYAKYKPFARESAKDNAIKVKAYLNEVRLRQLDRGIYDERAAMQELEDFLKWILNESGLLINPVTDMPKLKTAFMQFLLLCYNEEKEFANSVGIITAIGTKYLTYAACYYFIPAPANLVAPGLICAPIAYGIGKFSGYQFGKWTYRVSCVD